MNDTDNHGHSELSNIELRVRALESILADKGYIDPAAVDVVVETYETRVGPRGDRFVRFPGSAVRAHDGGRNHRDRAQHGRLHTLLLLPVGSAGPTAGLVQIGALPLPCGDRPARRARRVWVNASRGDPHKDLGFNRRAALPRHPDASGRDGRVERGATGRTRHPRLDDWDRAGALTGPGGPLVNGAQDMGGQMGFGPIAEETDEPPFHAGWEKRAFGLTIAMGAAGAWNIDMGRYARESLPPAEYLSSSYYEIWTKGLEKLLLQAGLVTADELEAGHALGPGPTVKHVLKPEEVLAGLRSTGGSSQRPTETPARFAVGDRVVTRNMHPRHRSGSTPCSSPGWSCGARTPTRHRRPRSTPGKATLNPAEALGAAVAPPFAPIPRAANGGPVFEEPWQARAFAITLALHERGLFTWTEWASGLAREIRNAQAAGDPDSGSTYYRHWLTAIEHLVVHHGLVTSVHLDERRAAWHRAAHATPHGQPILLTNDPKHRTPYAQPVTWKQDMGLGHIPKDID